MDAETTELNQIDEHKSFLDKGVGFNPGSDCKRVRVHMVGAVKHDGRHKARMTAGRHLTETPVDSVCSSVVSSRGVRLPALTGELNGFGQQTLAMLIWKHTLRRKCMSLPVQSLVTVKDMRLSF